MILFCTSFACKPRYKQLTGMKRCLDQATRLPTRLAAASSRAACYAYHAAVVLAFLTRCRDAPSRAESCRQREDGSHRRSGQEAHQWPAMDPTICYGLPSGVCLGECKIKEIPNPRT